MTLRKPAEVPRRLSPGNRELEQVLSLIRSSFAYMDGRVDPPSSMHRLTLETIDAQAQTGEVWVIGDPVQACVFLTPRSDHLYLGKLAVAKGQRGRGLGRRLLSLAEGRARDLGYASIQLESRVELVENHAIFAVAGYERIGQSAHPGYDRPTSYRFGKGVS